MTKLLKQWKKNMAQTVFQHLQTMEKWLNKMSYQNNLEDVNIPKELNIPALILEGSREIVDKFSENQLIQIDQIAQEIADPGKDD